jgi:putative ABC transport system substrate-binding protein
MKVSPGLSPWSGRSYCDPEGEKWVQAFLRGMAQLGWRLGTNFQLDVRWVATDFNRTQALARELVQTQPDVIEVTSTPATAAIMRETQTIPVVFASVSDPVGAGFIQTLTRPGGLAPLLPANPDTAPVLRATVGR